MKLYELTQKYNELWEYVMDEETDLELLEEALRQVEDCMSDKAENIAKIIKSLDADIETIKAEEKRLQDKRKSLENKKESLKQYLEMQFKEAGIDKVKTPIFTIAIQNNPPSVNVIDESLIPEKYFIQQAPVLDKKLLLSELKNGVIINGAEIKQTKSIRIR